MKKQLSDTLPLGAVLRDQYKIQKVLGRGGHGLTYCATDLQTNTTVAIKEFFTRNMSLREESGRVFVQLALHQEHFTWGLVRFLDEARNLSRFRHKNIVQVIDLFEENATAYIVMVYEDGETLESILKAEHTLSESRILSIVLPLLEGLEQVHDAGFIHRDIKPDNIYIRRHDKSPVLLDFGSARQAIGVQTKTLTSVLTPGYAPFEQYLSSNKRQGPWTDIYSMAAVMYRAVGGNLPVAATDRSNSLMLEEPDPMPSALDIGNGRYSVLFLKAIDKALRVLERDRPQAVKEWREALVCIQHSVRTAVDVDNAATVMTAISNTTQPEMQVNQSAVDVPIVPAASAAEPIVPVAPAVESSVSARWQNQEGAKSAITAAPARPVDRSSKHVTSTRSASVRIAAKPPAPVVSLASTSADAGVPIKLQKHNHRGGWQKFGVAAGIAVLISAVISAGYAYLQQYNQQENMAALESSKKAEEQRLKLRKVAERQHLADKKMELNIQQADLLLQNARSKKITNLLAQAQANLQQNNLTEPEGTNAWAQYKAVEQLDPENEEALAGILRIQSLILELAASAEKQQAFSKVFVYLAKAKALGVDETVLAKARSRVLHAMETNESQMAVQR